MTPDERVDAIRTRLTQVLAPCEVVVTDESHAHAGHAGARDGRGHFAVTVISARFDGQTQLARHRVVYDAVGELMQTDIHALSIRALTPKELP